MPKVGTGPVFEKDSLVAALFAALSPIPVATPRLGPLSHPFVCWCYLIAESYGLPLANVSTHGDKGQK